MAVKEQHVEAPAVSPGAGYDADFFQWTQSTAEMIRRGRLAGAWLEVVELLIGLVIELVGLELTPATQPPQQRAAAVAA